jgi:hypothetical protein
MLHLYVRLPQGPERRRIIQSVQDGLNRGRRQQNQLPAGRV